MQPHGIMFHYFHDRRHPAGQGSLSADDLANLLRHIGPERILPARSWLQRGLAGELGEDDLCLTFDDNLRCQYDVALPVLQDFGLTAFWFVSTAVMQGQLSRLDIYRKFRVGCFEQVNDFYEAYFRTLATSRYAQLAERALRQFDAGSYLSEYPFYSEADRRFRFVRDEVLGPEHYNEIMDALIGSMGYRLEDLARELWLEDEHMRRLHAAGHAIGLHTHTHPTRVAQMTPADQLREYRDNYTYLMQLLGQAPEVMSHPCNSYNADTLAVLERLGIRIGFRANMSMCEHSALEFPREDHANIQREMKSCGSRYSQVTSPVM